MPWDGIRRRAEDKGIESPEVILARIDERTANTDKNFEKHVTNFDKHVEKDEKNFAGLYKLVWAGGGIFGFVSFLIMVFKK